MISNKKLDALRESVCEGLSEYRARHILEVEKMVVRLGELYVPKINLNKLRAAALLHDITKELKTDEQLKLCKEYGIELSACDINSPKTLHAITAAAIIPEKYPAFADDKIISAVRWHTTGRAGMRLFDKLIFLADSIDMSRTFEDCIAIRNFFWEASPEDMDMPSRSELLRQSLILACDFTVKLLVDEGAPISPYTVEMRNDLIISGRK